MAVKSSHCSLCQRDFVNSAALQMHIATSNAHQVQVRTSKASTHDKATGATASQSATRPGHEDTEASNPTNKTVYPPSTACGTGNKHPGKGNMPAKVASTRSSSSRCCGTCRRTFATIDALQVHLRLFGHEGAHSNSKNNSPATPSDVRKLVPGNLHQQNNNSISLRSRNSFPTTTGLPEQLLEPDVLGNDVRARISRKKSDELISSIQHGGHEWSMIPLAQRLVVFEMLQMNCHTSEDLKRHKWGRVHYTPYEASKLGKCKRCGSKYWSSHSFETPSNFGLDLRHQIEKQAHLNGSSHIGKRPLLVRELYSALKNSFASLLTYLVGLRRGQRWVLLLRQCAPEMHILSGSRLYNTRRTNDTELPRICTCPYGF